MLLLSHPVPNAITPKQLTPFHLVGKLCAIYFSYQFSRRCQGNAAKPIPSAFADQERKALKRNSGAVFAQRFTGLWLAIDANFRGAFARANTFHRTRAKDNERFISEVTTSSCHQ